MSPSAICLSDCRCAIEHIGVGGKPRVRIAQIGRDRPESGHVERLRIRQVRDLRRDKVKDAGRRDEFTRLEQRSQGPHSHLSLPIGAGSRFAYRSGACWPHVGERGQVEHRVQMMLEGADDPGAVAEYKPFALAKLVLNCSAWSVVVSISNTISARQH